MPFLRNWKSDKLFNLSKIYLDDSVTNETNLLSDGIRKARIASLLAPNDSLKKENFLKLLYRLKPTEALLIWSDTYADKVALYDKKIQLTRRCLATLSDIKISTQERLIAGKIALKHLSFLEKDNNWFNSPENSLLSAKILAELGHAEQAKTLILRSLSNHSSHIESIFFLTRIIVHLKDKANLPFVGRKLAEFSIKNNESGKEAIRHMTLIHLLQPLSKSSLNKCVELLDSNEYSEPIDYMRVFALLYQIETVEQEKDKIIETCSSYFDLNDNKEHFVFCNWLGNIEAHSQIPKYLSSAKAKTDEELFKLRINALANTNDLESIHYEVNNAPSIPTRWRLAIEARAHSLQGNFIDATKILDRLLVSLGNDPRHVRSVCNYLEVSNDIKGLSHILEKLTDHPIHQVFALTKLIQYRSSSATLEELLGWMEKLSSSKTKDETFTTTILYFQLLDPLLPSPSEKLNKLLKHALKNYELNNNSIQNRIILALAHLRNQSADKALVALGSSNDWRKWGNSRPAWALIASEVYKLNFDTEKSLVIIRNIKQEAISRAEKESFKKIFTKNSL